MERLDCLMQWVDHGGGGAGTGEVEIVVPGFRMRVEVGT